MNQDAPHLNVGLAKRAQSETGRQIDQATQTPDDLTVRDVETIRRVAAAMRKRLDTAEPAERR
jgi:hypothetical protein